MMSRQESKFGSSSTSLKPLRVEGRPPGRAGTGGSACAGVQRVGLAREQLDPPGLHDQTPAQLVALELALRPAVGVAVVEEPSRSWMSTVNRRRGGGVVPAAAVERLVVVGLVERETALHLLAELDSACSSLPSTRSIMRSAKRSATAAIVNDGFGPTGPGITEPSATNRPGRPNTSPQVSTTPSRGCVRHGAAAHRVGESVPARPR